MINTKDYRNNKHRSNKINFKKRLKVEYNKYKFNILNNKLFSRIKLNKLKKKKLGIKSRFKYKKIKQFIIRKEKYYNNLPIIFLKSLYKNKWSSIQRQISKFMCLYLINSSNKLSCTYSSNYYKYYLMYYLLNLYYIKKNYNTFYSTVISNNYIINNFKNGYISFQKKKNRTLLNLLYQIKSKNLSDNKKKISYPRKFNFKQKSYVHKRKRKKKKKQEIQVKQIRYKDLKLIYSFIVLLVKVIYKNQKRIVTTVNLYKRKIKIKDHYLHLNNRYKFSKLFIIISLISFNRFYRKLDTFLKLYITKLNRKFQLLKLYSSRSELKFLYKFQYYYYVTLYIYLNIKQQNIITILNLYKYRLNKILLVINKLYYINSKHFLYKQKNRLINIKNNLNYIIKFNVKKLNKLIELSSLIKFKLSKSSFNDDNIQLEGLPISSFSDLLTKTDYKLNNESLSLIQIDYSIEHDLSKILKSNVLFFKNVFFYNYDYNCFFLLNAKTICEFFIYSIYKKVQYFNIFNDIKEAFFDLFRLRKELKRVYERYILIFFVKYLKYIQSYYVFLYSNIVLSGRVNNIQFSMHKKYYYYITSLNSRYLFKIQYQLHKLLSFIYKIGTYMNELNIEGIRIKTSGRKSRKLRADHKWFSRNRMPLSCFKHQIDYFYKPAITRFSSLGIKVYLYKEKDYNTPLYNYLFNFLFLKLKNLTKMII